MCRGGAPDGMGPVWPLPSQRGQAVSLAVSLIAERRREPSGVEVGASRAVLVDHTLIRESRTAILIELWQAPHGYVFQNHRQQVVGIRRAARQIDDRLSGNHGVG